MKLKKFASLGLAIVAALALAVPVFANNADSYNDKQSQSVTMQGGATVPTIQIVLPSGAALTNTFLLNPYKISYDEIVGGTTMSGDSTVSGGVMQVISPIQYITNATNSIMEVDVTVTTTLAGNLKLLTAPYTDAAARQADTKNNAFLFVKAKNASTKSGGDFNTYSASNPGTALVLKAGDVKKSPWLCTPAASKSNPAYIAIQFGGEMAEAPDVPWTTKDVAKVAFAFTFTPNQNATVTSG